MSDEQTIRDALALRSCWSISHSWVPSVVTRQDAFVALDRLVARAEAAEKEARSLVAERDRATAAMEAAEKERDGMERRLTSALAASEEALHQMHEAKDRLADYQDDVRAVMAEECPDPMERHCTCVPPLRKAAQAAESRCATLEAALREIAEDMEGVLRGQAVNDAPYAASVIPQRVVLRARAALAAATPPAEPYPGYTLCETCGMPETCEDCQPAEKEGTP